jgi:ATP synthase protein I
MAEDETDEVPKLPPDARLESLDQRLARLQERKRSGPEYSSRGPGTRVAQHLRSI